MNRIKQSSIALALLGVLLGIPSAADNAVADSVTPPPELPVTVQVGIYLVDIGHISEIDNTFNAEMDFIGRWTDSRLAFDAEAEGSDRRVYVGPKSEEFRTSNWNSQIVVKNAVGIPDIVSQKIVVHADGQVVIIVRANATLRADLDYRHFPFDEQVLPVHIESFAWNKNIIELEPLVDQTGFDPSFDLPEWRVTDVRTVLSDVTRPRTSEPFARVAFNIHIDRKAGFYLWKIFLPLIIIVSISWVTFWMNDEMLGRRAGVSVTGILTVIAYQFIVASLIPRVSYLTALDRVMLFSIVLIASTLVVSIAVDRVKRRRGDAAALRIDRACRFAFPAAYFGLIFYVLVTSAL